MPTVVKIGYQEFWVKSEAQAVKIVTALAGAMALESTFVVRETIYWPSYDRCAEISMVSVRPTQLVQRDPRKDKGTVDKGTVDKGTVDKGTVDKGTVEVASLALEVRTGGAR